MIGRCDGTQSVSHPLFIKHLPLKLMKKYYYFYLFSLHCTSIVQQGHKGIILMNTCFMI